MLHTGTTVVIDILLNLRFAQAISWLINRHLDVLIEVSDDDRPQRGVVRVDHLVVDGPESMEVQHLLIPGCGGLHLAIGLISDAVVHIPQVWPRHHIIENFLQVVRLE